MNSRDMTSDEWNKDLDYEQQKVEVARLAKEMEKLSSELVSKARALLQEVEVGATGHGQ